MDVLEFIKTGGRKTIPNPDYNPRSKKNKGPKTIDVIDLGPEDNSPLFNLAKADLENHWSVSADELEKYGNYGINYNPREAASGELDRLLAERQGAMTKLGNSVAQAVVSEVGLGTAKGITDLFDVFSGAVFRSDNDYSNPASEYLEKLQEDFRDKVAPIYTDPNKNIGNGGLLDAGWWASNLPSVMSSLTLMIPSTGITKGLSWLGKGLNLASKGKLASFGRGAYKVMTGASKAKTAEEAAKLNGFTKWLNNPNTMKAASRMGETTVNAALMRTMENYQESRQVYNDMKKQALDKFNNISDEEYNNIISQNADKLEDVDTSDKEAVAERLASLSADRTFLMDYANTFFDVVQLNALRNPIKLLKNMRGTRAINKAQRESIKNTLEAAGVKATEAAEKAGLASTTKNFGRSVKDFLKDSGVAVKAELSEGVEEAVNYIAQEEGMHFGNVALGEDVDKGFKSRLGSYMRSPELYDAAFWGVMGGIVFQGLGSGFNRLSVAAERAYQNKKNKTNEKTGEATNKESWQELFETSENKRRVSAINKNVEDFNTLVGRLKQIGTEEEPGTDPFNVGEDKKPIPLTSNIERSLARERAIDEYITGMTFRAMDNGNFDMLKAYLQDDEIQKVLNQVTDNENDGGAFVQSLVDRMDNIADKYNENLIALSNIATNVNIKGTDNIPIEYLQIIARDNTYNQIKLERLENQIGAYETSAANKEAQYGSKLDKSLNYKDTVQLVVLTKNLAELKERKAELENDKENKGFGKQIELDDINRKIRIVEDMIKGSKETSNSDSLTRLLYSTIMANKINDTNLEAQNLTDLMSGNIAGILGEERAKEFETSDIELMKVLGEDRQSGAYKTLASDINSVFEGEYGLNKIDKRLGDDYYMLAALNMEKQSINQNIIMNEKNLSEKVNELHNSMLESRVNAIDKASDNLKQLARKYGRETIANNLESGAEINWQNEQDKSLFNDSLEILNLTSSSNQKLYSNIQDMLFFDELIGRSQEENNEDGENSSTSENQNAGSQNGGSNNQFGQNSQTNENGETTLNGEENSQGQPQAEQKPINEEDDKAATETVNNLRGKSFKKLTDDELNEVLDDINSHLTPEKSISDDNRQQLNVHKARLEKEINSRKNNLKSKTDKELIDRYNSMSGASNGEELEELQSITKELNRRGIDPATISSTGGQVADSTTPTPAKKEQRGKPSKQFDEFGNPIKDPNRTKVENEISKELNDTAKKAKADNTDIATAINAKIQELNTKYGDDEEYKQYINRMSRCIAVRAEKSGLISDVANIVLLASSIEERGGKYQFVGDYLKQTEEFVDKFLKAANAKSFNGKRLVSFEAILRFANEQMEDPTTAQYIYGMMKSWFKDGPNKDKYIVLENMDSTSIFDRTSKTDKELVEERLGGTSIFRVQIDKFLKDEHSKKAFDELNVGDELQVEVLDGDIVLMHNGIAVGRLPQPAISSLGGFTQANDGWITDVSLEQGNVVSRLRKVWEDILLNNTPINNKINNYIYQIIGANKTNSNVNEIRKAIENDKELTEFFKGLKKESIVEGTASNIKLINGLVSIWNYIDLTHPDQAKREELINLSLDLWFNKLYDTYTKITNTNTLGAKNFKFTVTKVTDGDIIQVANNNPNGYNECTLGKDNDAIADVDKTQIGVINFGSFGIIQTTTNEKVSQPSSGPGSIWAIFPNRSGIPGIIRGHSLRFNDDDPKIKDTAAGRIKEAIINEFENRIRNIGTDNGIDGLFNFIEQCFGKRLGTPLLASIGGGIANVQPRKDAKLGDRLHIKIKLNKTDYLNFTINKDSRSYHFDIGTFKSDYESIDEIDNFIKDFKEQILSNATFNASFDYFKSDANTDTPLDGLATRDRDGNFVIAIPNSKGEPLIETFPSFKHFMFQGGAARWNTKNVDGSNYQAKSEAQVRNRVLNVSIEQQSSRPVEEISPSTITPESVNDGTAIDTLIEQHFGKNSSAVKRLQELGLIPSKIIYTKETLMKGDHPSHIWTSISKKEIYVDDEFIKTMNENPDMAIRKLIHEQLHLKLHSKGNRRKELLNRISEIITDFREALDNDTNADPHLREYLFEHISNNEERLEEFLVESLTNRELASYLNSVQTEIPGTKTKKSLLNKILDLLAEIFDWGVTEGSLYEKELRVLQGFTNENQNVKQPTVREGTLDFKEDEDVKQEEQNVQQEETSTEDEESEDEFDEDDVVATSVREVTVSPAISTEMQSIKERAIANGTFMKAPNGKDTNLTERQWLQVRTKAFINWFGDWINDPANASKVVDENGEPKVMYHATPWGEFSVFKQFQPSTGDRTKAGELYFGNSERMVQRYTRGEFNEGNRSPKVYAVFLNIKNPYKNAEVINKQQLDDILEDLKNYLTPKEFESIQKKVYDNWNTEEEYNLQYHSYNVYNTLANYFKNNNKDRFYEVVRNLRNSGHKDGMFFLTKEEWEGQPINFREDIKKQVWVMDPNQIKSATDNNGEFSTENDDIRASSVQETTAPSVNQFVESLPLEERINFDKLLLDGTVSTKCS